MIDKQNVISHIKISRQYFREEIDKDPSRLKLFVDNVLNLVEEGKHVVLDVLDSFESIENTFDIWVRLNVLLNDDMTKIQNLAKKCLAKLEGNYSLKMLNEFDFSKFALKNNRENFESFC